MRGALRLFYLYFQPSRALGIDSFPSLAVEKSGRLHHIGLSYTDPQAMLSQIESI